MKVPVYIYAEINTYDHSISYRAYFSKTANHMGTLAHTTELEFPEPAWEVLVTNKVAQLRKKIQQDRADCEQQVQESEEEIGKLLALPAPASPDEVV